MTWNSQPRLSSTQTNISEATRDVRRPSSAELARLASTRLSKVEVGAPDSGPLRPSSPDREHLRPRSARGTRIAIHSI